MHLPNNRCVKCNQGFDIATDIANTGPFCDLTWWTCRFKLWMALFILGGVFSATTTVPYITHDRTEPAYDLWWTFVSSHC